MRESHLKWNADILAPLLIFSFTLLLYLLTKSCSLDEWDSVNFALGVTDFDLFRFQPHPPGYPLYIFSGWLLHTFLKLKVETALIATACFCGALYVTAWFLIFRRFTNSKAAYISTLILIFTPATWMTATKALTDIPSSSFLALQVLFAGHVREKRTFLMIGCTALSAAAASGIRPQYTFISLVIFFFALVDARLPLKTWITSILLITLLFGCWLIPTMITQASKVDGEPGWDAYFHLLTKQWQWRLHRPSIYMGAEGFTPGKIISRAGEHTGRWFTHGFGLKVHPPVGMAVGFLFLLGLYLFIRNRAWLNDRQREFWTHNLPWALIHIAIIMVALPPDTRYYCPILPIFILVPVTGLLSLPSAWRSSAAALPALLLFLSLPLAFEAHSVEAPPIRMLRYIESQHPEDRGEKVYLFLGLSRRQVTWYSSGFTIQPVDHPGIRAEELKMLGVTAYTDDPDFLTVNGWKGLKMKKIALFERSDVIYRKHSRVELYQVAPCR